MQTDSGKAGLSFMADTTALVLFFTVTGTLNERFIAGMDWGEVARARLIGAPLMVLTARPYGVWRDWMMAHARSGWFHRLGWDTAALLLFQVPIYAAIIWAGGASAAELLRGTLGAAALMMALGRPYGAFLDAVRGFFGLPPGGQKPMSIDPDR
ncbi:L-alanine exporter AlaE [Paracoccus sp. TK19116]|uniref:L-alanine exporter AlaE n=1 Tax=Paracoccus albicereus TaxID=2922394 RepID=A0ABT1MTF7_9RHOB|nr:L-alanine exporter AlaE [Paracoccus albicereus]MCQ0971608.1 L-alanine exporter AlaE [Paracoccus albicereus]